MLFEEHEHGLRPTLRWQHPKDGRGYFDFLEGGDVEA